MQNTLPSYGCHAEVFTRSQPRFAAPAYRYPRCPQATVTPFRGLRQSDWGTKLDRRHDRSNYNYEIHSQSAALYSQYISVPKFQRLNPFNRISIEVPGVRAVSRAADGARTLQGSRIMLAALDTNGYIVTNDHVVQERSGKMARHCRLSPCES